MLLNPSENCGLGIVGGKKTHIHTKEPSNSQNEQNDIKYENNICIQLLIC